MNKIIQLHQYNWTLQIALHTDDWCECTLIGETQTYRLGAESPSYIAKKLFTALCELNEQVMPDSQSYLWVLSLAEIHSSLYIAQERDFKFLLWQDADANTLAQMCLSSEDCLTWCNQLKQII
jgi:hypothetical protein